MTETSIPVGSGAAGASTTERREAREFGGGVGAAALMAGSHVGLYYLWYAVRFNGGAAPFPGGAFFDFASGTWTRSHTRIGRAPSAEPASSISRGTPRSAA